LAHDAAAPGGYSKGMKALILALVFASPAVRAQSDAEFVRALQNGEKAFLLQTAAKPKPAPKAKKTVKPRWKTECILSEVLSHLHREPKADAAAPRVRFESEVPLSEFQDAVEKQWRMRPPRVSNVFIAETGQIFLIDDAEYYERVHRFIDDSLAHELTHFVQVRYGGAKLDEESEYLESEAVAVQTWFRETHLASGAEPPAGCALP
jgi:hypothetical protein